MDLPEVEGSAGPPLPSAVSTKEQTLLDGMEIAAVVIAPGGEVEALSSRAAQLLGLGAAARTEDELLAALSRASHDPRQPEALARAASEGQVRLPLLHDGELLLERRPLAGGRRIWLLARSRKAQLSEAATRERVLAVAVHDLRSPLANVRSYAGMVLTAKGPPLPPRVARAAEVIARNAERGLRLTDELGELLRSEAGSLAPELERVPVAIGELVRAVLDETRELAAEKGVLLGADAVGPMPTLQLDEERVRRVLRSLIEAALRRSPPGGQVRLRAELQADGVQLAVDDSGPPPNEEEAALAFDRDHVILTERKLQPGVSMALARALAEAHGGKVGCTPLPSGASHFVWLPR